MPSLSVIAPNPATQNCDVFKSDRPLLIGHILGFDGPAAAEPWISAGSLANRYSLEAASMFMWGGGREEEEEFKEDSSHAGIPWEQGEEEEEEQEDELISRANGISIGSSMEGFQEKDKEEEVKVSEKSARIEITASVVCALRTRGGR